jgi:hypothetical protein
MSWKRQVTVLRRGEWCRRCGHKRGRGCGWGCKEDGGGGVGVEIGKKRRNRIWRNWEMSAVVWRNGGNGGGEVVGCGKRENMWRWERRGEFE